MTLLATILTALGALGASYYNDGRRPGYPLTVDVYETIRGGTNVQTHLLNPGDQCCNTLDWRNIFGVIPIDTLLMQTIPTVNNLQQYLDSEVPAMVHVVNLDNDSTTEVLMYESWANEGILNDWYAFIDNPSSEFDLWKRDVYDALVIELRSQVPNDVYIIPVGDLYYAMRNSEEPLYRDGQHASVFMQGFLNQMLITSVTRDYQYIQDQLVWEVLIDNPLSQFKRGDADLDSDVDITDFNILVGNFGTGTEWTQGNFDFDLDVDITDFNILAINFGSPSSIPESSTFKILLYGLILLGVVYRGNRKERNVGSS